MSDCKAFTEWCERVGDDVANSFLERLCDMEWNGCEAVDGISISSTHRHDAINCTHSGTFTHGGTEYGFVIDNGNWAGTVVREWGMADDVGLYEPPKPTIWTFVPQNGTLKEDRPAMWGVYLEWRKSKWFKEKERGYNYDKHFAPGGKTESYYRDWAATKGLKIETQDHADRIIARPKRDLIPLADIEAVFGKESQA